MEITLKIDSADLTYYYKRRVHHLESGSRQVKCMSIRIDGPGAEELICAVQDDKQRWFTIRLLLDEVLFITSNEKRTHNPITHPSERL